MASPIIRARRGRPGLGENELVELTEAAAVISALNLGVLRAKRPTMGIRDRPFEVALVQHLFEYLLMYPGLDSYEIGWEVRYTPGGLVDLVLRNSNKTVLVECKDFKPGDINGDAKKLRGINVTTKFSARYVLSWWRQDVPSDVGDRVATHYSRANGLDSALTELVAYQSFSLFVPGTKRAPFAVALFKVK